MKSLLLSVLMVSFISIYSQDSCVVKVFPNDCQNCYIGMRNVESAQKDVKKTIVFPNMPQAEVNAYLKNVLNIHDESSYTIIVSDSVYHSLNTNLTSEVYLYRGNELFDHTILKQFQGIDEMAYTEIKIPDTIAISGGSTLINQQDYFFITDPKFGDFIFISKYGDHKIDVITADAFTTESNFERISGDTICYSTFLEYREILKSANMDKMKIQSSFIKRDLMAAYLLAPDIQVINGEAGLMYKNGLIIFNKPSDYTILRIDEKSIPKNYVINAGFYYQYKEGHYIQLTNIDRTLDDQFILGKFQLENNKLVFSEFPDYKIPTEYLPSSKFMSLRKILSSAGPYVFLQYSNSYFDLEKNQTFQLPLDTVNLNFEFQNLDINQLKFEYSFQLIDAIIFENTIQVLFEESGIYYVGVIDRIDNSLIKKSEIMSLSKPIKAGMNFYSPEKIFYLANDNTIVIEQIKYKQ